MQARQNRKDSTRTDVVGYQRTFRRERSGAAVETRLHMRQVSETEVGVHHEPRRQYLAEREAPWIADDAVAGAAVTIAGRQDQTKSRRERLLQVALFQRLLTVVDQNVADTVDAVCSVDQVKRRNRVREIML